MLRGKRLRPLLPVSNRRCGRWRDHRQVIDGIPHRVRTGVQGREPPERFGPWKRAVNRLEQHRAVATRCDKRRYVHLGTATVAALTIWLRT
ncbi:transposase [Streptomyces sp. NBC_01218]|uniref:transposase n=1 Tax=Streptomyces sp. NBC_01218 TaxID=2903780 RepID=UPI002E129921|nr:transposase [Streptomyces sp. NBC_01218]